MAQGLQNTITIIGPTGITGEVKRDNETLYTTTRCPKRKTAWFVIDLQTGANNKNWFPGCCLEGKADADTELYASPSEMSEVIGNISKNEQLILPEIDNKNNFDKDEGYIKGYYVADLTYTARDE